MHSLRLALEWCIDRGSMTLINLLLVSGAVFTMSIAASSSVESDVRCVVDSETIRVLNRDISGILGATVYIFV